MVERYQYPAHVEGRPPTIPDFGWFLQETDVVRLPHQVGEGIAILGQPPSIPSYGWSVPQVEVIHRPHQVNEGVAAQPLEPITVAVPDFAWYSQHPEQVFTEKPRPYFYPSQEFRTELPFPVTLDQWWQPASEPVRIIPPIQPGIIAFLDIEDVSLVVYSQAGWPFVALVNPADYPAGTQFFFEVILATDNGAITTYARLHNLTTAALIAGSTLSTATTGLGDRLRSGAITLTAGDNEYIPERGDASGTSHVRLYAARIIKVTP